MDKDLFEHELIYIHDGPHRECLKNLGIPHYQIKGLLWRYDPIIIIRLIRQLVRSKPDIIHTLLWAANIAGRIAGKITGIPVVSAWHNNLDQDGRFRTIFDRLTYRMAQTHIAVSHGVLESAYRLGFRVPSSQIQVIPNGINSSMIKELSKEVPLHRADIGLNYEQYVIGSVGRFMPVKRYDIMLEAFALFHRNYPQSRLVLVGIGEQEGFLRSRVEELGIAQAVIFIVGQPSYRYYPIFDCFSLSSDKEGVSIALLEAMSFQLPCVVTHADERHVVIEQGVNGLLAQAGNAQSLAAGWTTLMEDKKYAQELGLKAFLTVQARFSSKRMCLEYEEVFKNTMQGRIDAG